MATPRTRKPRPVVVASPFATPEEQVSTPEATPEEVQASLDADKCPQCKGFGLVRKAGSRAGAAYKTLAGAQAALANGNAEDCPRCSATGLVAL